MALLLFCGVFEEVLKPSPREGSLLSVSAEDAQSVQDTVLYPAAASTLEVSTPHRGALDNDTDNDGQGDGVADSLAGLAPAFLFTPLLGASFIVALHERPRPHSYCASVLERPG